MDETSEHTVNVRPFAWRRWTGIEPAGRGSLVPTALKAAEPTRYPDTSASQGSRRRSWGYSLGMKRFIMLVALVALVAAAVKKLQTA